MSELLKKPFTLGAKILLGLGLVVLVVIIIFPVFAQARMGGKQPCLSNLKQMFVGTMLYAEDNNDCMPLANWMDGLRPTVNEQQFHDRTAFKKPDYGYAFRDRVLGEPFCSIATPSKFILIFDSSLQGRNQHSELWSLAHGGTHGRFQGDPSSRDFVVNADGHVKTLSIIPPGALSGELSSFQKALFDDDDSQKINRLGDKPLKSAGSQ